MKRFTIKKAFNFSKMKRIVYSLLVGIGIFFASFLVPVIGGIISIPMGLIGAWIYYDYKK